MAVSRIVFFTYLAAITLVTQSSNKDCGRSFVGHRQPRNWTYSNEGRIINGKKSLRGAWPWQVSLQLLHPKYGLIGHWCGAVLIQPLWILTAAHCIHNDLFNLPLATLWTAVLGDWDRDVEENTEIRVPIDRIIVHERFHNYQNDIAIMKLSKPVEINTVCLPEELTKFNLHPELSKTMDMIPDQLVRNSNSTVTHRKGRRITSNENVNVLREFFEKYCIRLMGIDNGNVNRICRFGGFIFIYCMGQFYQSLESYPNTFLKHSSKLRWLSDQIQKISEKFQKPKKPQKNDYKFKSSTECIATGWGRYSTHGPMTSTLLQATVPLHDNSLCQAKYGSSIPIRTGHLCAGHLDGTTGTCVGDSGGPLQCSLKDGRWVLAGLTSFGSGCAKPGYPDVYTRLAFYMPWINKQINKYKD